MYYIQDEKITSTLKEREVPNPFSIDQQKYLASFNISSDKLKELILSHLR